MSAHRGRERKKRRAGCTVKAEVDGEIEVAQESDIRVRLGAEEEVQENERIVRAPAETRADVGRAGRCKRELAGQTRESPWGVAELTGGILR